MDSVVDSRPQRISGYVVLLLAGYAFAGGLISFLGWAMDLPRLTDWDSTGISIQPNTCVAMMLAALALILRQLGRKRIVIVLGAIVALIGSLTLLQHVAHRDFGFNHQLTFGREWGHLTTITPGRMGPPASISFTLVGIALILLGRCARREDEFPGSRHCSAVLGLSVCSLMMLSLFGYLFGAREFYAIPWLSAIALQTASMLMCVGGALIASAPDQQPMRLLLSNSIAGIMARRALPVVILVPPLFGWLRGLGEETGLYDEGTGRTLLVVSIIFVTVTVLWHTLSVVARQEQASKAANRYIEETLESLADGFTRIDPQWRFTYVNREAERLLMERHLMLGRKWQDVFGPAVGTEMEQSMRRVMSERVPVELEYYYEHWNRWFLVKLHPMEDGGLSSVFTDITGQKALQDTIRNSEVHLAEELARRTDQVVRAERALARNERMAAVGTLASGLAHDINNITMPLGLRMERLLKNPSVSRDIKTELTAVTALLEHLRSMSKNLSLFSRDPEQEGIVGLTDLPTWWGSVEMLIASSLFGNHAAPAGKIQLRGEIPRGLPPVSVAPHRLTQAVINLVHNARDAIMARGTDCDTNGNGNAQQGTITIRARAHAQLGESSVALSVVDDGCGMSPDVMARALEPFFTTKDRSEALSSGSGLGLSLVQAICERSGGTLEIESEVGTGTTVTMVLPVADKAQEAPALSRTS